MNFYITQKAQGTKLFMKKAPRAFWYLIGKLLTKLPMCQQLISLGFKTKLLNLVYWGPVSLVPIIYQLASFIALVLWEQWSGLTGIDCLVWLSRKQIMETYLLAKECKSSDLFTATYSDYKIFNIYLPVINSPQSREAVSNLCWSVSGSLWLKLYFKLKTCVFFAWNHKPHFID